MRPKARDASRVRRGTVGSIDKDPSRKGYQVLNALEVAESAPRRQFVDSDRERCLGGA